MGLIKQSLILLSIVYSFCILGVQAYPFGAGHCETGDAISTAAAHGPTGTSLQDGEFDLFINGNILEPDSTFSLQTGVSHTIILESDSGKSFKGFLFRLSGKGGENVKQLMTVDSGSGSIARTAYNCASDIAGVTHRSREGKTSVRVTLSHDETIELQLEMTVVFEFKTWHYTSYDLKVEDLATTTAPTGSPSNKPTGAPIATKEPTGSPSNKPSSKPTTPGATKEPTGSPSKKPSSAPSIESAVCKDSKLDFSANWTDRKLNCTWVRKKKSRCNKIWNQTHCPATCGKCDTLKCENSKKKFYFYNNEQQKYMKRGCGWIKFKDTEERCGWPGVEETCRETCGYCRVNVL